MYMIKIWIFNIVQFIRKIKKIIETGCKNKHQICKDCLDKI